MYRNNYYQQPNYGEQRFIGPLIPFIGGALVGYVVSRPNTFTPQYPVYYPPYQPYPYYYQTIPNNYPINN